MKSKLWLAGLISLILACGKSEEGNEAWDGNPQGQKPVASKGWFGFASRCVHKFSSAPSVKYGIKCSPVFEASTAEDVQAQVSQWAEANCPKTFPAQTGCVLETQAPLGHYERFIERLKNRDPTECSENPKLNYGKIVCS